MINETRRRFLKREIKEKRDKQLRKNAIGADGRSEENKNI